VASSRVHIQSPLGVAERNYEIHGQTFYQLSEAGRVEAHLGRTQNTIEIVNDHRNLTYFPEIPKSELLARHTGPYF